MTREMKNSGVEWIGDIPSEWKLEKNKHCFELTKNIVGGNFSSYELLSLTKKGIVIKDVNNSFGKVPESYETYQSVKKGQLVLCLFDLDCSAVFSGLSNHNGMISPAYKVYDCKNNIDKKYVAYWFDYCFDGRKYKIYSKSLRYVVNADDFGDIEIILPTFHEQKRIADFLDSKVTEIDKIISETKASIENYKEYKQSIITEAVTKGLDKNVPMKDSGIEWIGEIPCEWNIIKIKHIGTARNGLTYSPAEMSDRENGKIVLRSSNIKNGRLSFEDNVYVSKNIPENLMVRKNDILICSRNGSRHLIGKNTIIENDISASFGAFMMIFRTNCNVKYIKYILDSDVFKYYLGTFLTATINQLTNNNFSNMKFVFCPDEKQQEKIVNYLDGKCTEIDNLTSEKEKLITNLEEYKKSLIYEYVTGKKAVE